MSSAQSPQVPARILLQDGTVYHGFSFGFPASVSGEIVFNTGMVGYVEGLTDPSYAGQVVVLTYPLIGNYGVPNRRFFESPRIQAEGVIVSEHCEAYSHPGATRSFAAWLKSERIPGVSGVDTRSLTKKLRERGVMLGHVLLGGSACPRRFRDPNVEQLVEQVSIARSRTYGTGKKKIIAVDCGIKENIVRSLVLCGVTVKRVPWDYAAVDPDADGVLISNGPGDPALCEPTIRYIQTVMRQGLPIFGVCLGAQLLALATGAKTYKLTYGHRSQNQPVEERGSGRCFITSQNHGFAVDASTLPENWDVWFTNLNDGTVEGIRHRSKPWFAVQFHPEASPGPTDTGWLFDEFMRTLS